MIEQAMIFTLGFLLAGILALAVTPAFWRRAVRLARRRIEAQVPVSIEEILAERDQLRAQNAVECRRLEDRLAQLNRRHLEHLRELGQRAARIAAFEADVAAHQAEKSTLVAENDRLGRELVEATAISFATQKALFDAESVQARKSDEAIELGQTLSSVSALAEVRLASITAADNYARDLERRLDAMRNDLATVQTKLKDKAREANEASDLLAIARNDLAKAQKRIELEFLRATDLETTANTLRLERKADAAEIRGLALKLDNTQADLRDWQARENTWKARQDQQAEKMREGEGALAKQIQLLQSDNSALQGALEVARRRCDELERDLTALRRGEMIKQVSAAADALDNALPFRRVAKTEVVATRPSPLPEAAKPEVARDEAAPR